MSRQGLRPSDIRIEEQRATTARGTRAPEYNFGGINIPEYRLVPISFAPVFAGDTIKSCRHQARIIASSPANNMVQGAWFEFWTFNVRIGDMADAESIRDVLIDPAGGATVNWRSQCMNSIWNAYFKDEADGVSWSDANFLRNPRVGWWDTSRDKDTLPDTSGAADDWEADWIRYQAMRRAKITMKTWPEYLAAQGVNVPPQLKVEDDPEQKVPELLQYSREFVYPQMNMAPTTGGDVVPTGTLQWFINGDVKRSRFCAEPGFVVTCVALRPKKYVMGYSSAGSTVAGGDSFDPLTILNDAQGWQPIDLDTDPHTALVAVPGGYFGDTVLGAEQIVDTRELFIRGHDEWLDGTNRNKVGSSAVPFTRIDPVKGSRPTAASITYAIDARVKLAVASRVNKEVTR